MRPVFLFGLCAVAILLAASSAAWAGGPNPDNYPLRVHVFKFVQRPADKRLPKVQSDTADYTSGYGQGDLFENGDPRGFLFSYSCMASMNTSGGYGTFPARWKKRDKTLEILLPEQGKPWNLETCELKTEMRTGLVYFWRDGGVSEEAAALLKDWMVKHKFNPEKSETDPILLVGDVAADDPLVTP